MTSTHQVIERLHDRGVRLTMQRRLVIEALCEHGGHMGVHDVQQYLRHHGADLNDTTVYRILQWLKDLGVVSQTDLGRTGLAYQLVGDEPHHHLVCLSCGRIIDVDNRLIEPLIEQVRRQYGFEPRVDHMAIFGWCRDCLAERRDNSLPEP
jgi:Fur family ferric uptake transcriptional regulator